MTDKRDKLGRKIPVFDRSAAGKKAAATLKERTHDDTIHAKYGARGGKYRTRGYFGKLKDEGKADELAALSLKGALKTNQIKAFKKEDKLRTDTEG